MRKIIRRPSVKRNSPCVSVLSRYGRPGRWKSAVFGCSQALSIGFLAILWIVSFSAQTLDAQEYQTDAENSLEVTKALMVIEEFMNSPDREAVAGLMRHCAGVAIFPSVYKGAFIVGAEYGTGVMCSYDRRTKQWSAPAFFRVGGGSFGYQIGAKATDLILIIANRRGLESLMRDNVTLGGDIAVAAGPVGRDAQAATDMTLKAGIYSYSRSKGVFAGVSLKGAVISPDLAANQSYYGNVRDPADILLHGKVKPSGAAAELIRVLEEFVE